MTIGEVYKVSIQALFSDGIGSVFQDEIKLGKPKILLKLSTSLLIVYFDSISSCQFVKYFKLIFTGF